jgi:hypothetical protein
MPDGLLKQQVFAEQNHHGLQKKVIIHWAAFVCRWAVFYLGPMQVKVQVY